MFKKKSAPSGLIIEVQIPLGKKPGDQLVAAAPDGRQIQVIVPDRAGRINDPNRVPSRVNVA
jgi:hypothetical protein